MCPFHIRMLNGNHADKRVITSSCFIRNHWPVPFNTYNLAQLKFLLNISVLSLTLCSLTWLLQFNTSKSRNIKQWNKRGYQVYLYVCNFCCLLIDKISAINLTYKSYRKNSLSLECDAEATIFNHFIWNRHFTAPEPMACSSVRHKVLIYQVWAESVKWYRD